MTQGTGTKNEEKIHQFFINVHVLFLVAGVAILFSK